MSESLKLTKSLEDYLETILEIEKKNRVARVKEIAEKLKVQMPSVTSALKTLKGLELVNYEKNSYISLSEKGMKYAKAVLNRHNICREFLEEVLYMESKVADEEACRLEHAISPETAAKLSQLTAFLNSSRVMENWKKTLK